MKKCKFCLTSNDNRTENCITCNNDKFWVDKQDGFTGDVTERIVKE